MTKRLKILLVSGAAALAITALACLVAIRRARLEISEPRSYVWQSDLGGKEPLVQLGYDGPYWHVASAIRIDVIRGVPHTRGEVPIEDLTSFVNAELDKNTREWVVVTASMDEKFGDVMRVIDECRKSRVKGVVLNQFPLGWQDWKSPTSRGD